MKRTLDTIAEQCRSSGFVLLSQDETKIYIPNLDRKIKQHNTPHSTSNFSANQGGYMVYAKATYTNGTYIARIYQIIKKPKSL